MYHTAPKLESVLPLKPTPYVVYMDLQDHREDKIHRDSCKHYLDRDRNATTVRWDEGPYYTKQSAVHATQIERESQCCNP